ncbi:MAG: SusC/RagA family protein [Pseudopedobacter saltans]|uniref:SusC/RagA family protein n=1 Tax=Pseudopedobacter saltans TaxID=151895 RepID=A0A2W5EUA9_9SPHI|nr:MAG: SusC/RagA family protein [Pseudopedobacter saltans]
MFGRKNRRIFLAKLFFVIVFLVFTYFNTYAQITKQLNGTVTDGNGNPLSGATVFLRELRGSFSLNTSTDSLGNFVAENIPNGNYNGTISLVGYKSSKLKSFSVDGSPLSFKLLQDSTSLSEVVVIGYGSQKKNTFSGAVAQVSLDKLGSRSLNDIGSVLQGKAPGVIVINNSGDPTSSPQVNIRGIGGINGETPLYVVDGSIYTGTPNINPNDIESISVLKDGAAAIYGARASGGVVLITTKKGKVGRLNLTLDAKIGWQKAHKLLQSLNAAEYAQVSNEAADAAGIARNDAFNASVYPDGQITRTNWIESIFRTAPMRDYNVGLNGGNEKSTYYLGFDYRKADGILINTYTERYNFRINSEHKLNNWLKIGEQVYYSYANGNGANTSSGYTGAILSAIFYPPSVPLFDSAGKYSGLPAKYSGAYGDVINPYAYLKRLDAVNPVHVIVANPYAEITLMKGLKFRSNFSYNATFDNSKSFQTRILEIGKIFDYNQLNRASNTYSDILSEQTLSYDNIFEKHHISAVAGYTYQKTTREGWSAYVQGFSDESDNYRYMLNASQYFLPNEYKNEQALESYFARFNYDYDQRYLLSLIGRRDGSSLVSKDNRYANYGSISGGWVLSKESFLKDVSWLSNLKLRASYGILGNLGSVTPNAVSPTLLQSAVFMGQDPKQIFGYYASTLANPDLKWAQSKQTDIGLDLGLWKNRLSFTADYFLKKTSNMLMYVPLSGTTGVDGQWKNGGEAQDKGFEFGLNYNSETSNTFQYSINASVTTLQNELLSLPNDITSSSVDYNVRGALNPIRLIVGQPLYSYYLVKTNGLFQSQAEINSYTNSKGGLIQPNAKPGDIKFVDANGDGKISNDDRVASGSGYPKVTYNMSLNFSYKGFDLNVFLQGVSGNKIFNALKYTGLNAGVGQNYNMLKGILNAWTPTNTNTDVPRITASDANGNFGTNSDFYLESGRYLRVKNATLGYTFPSALIQKVKIQSARFFITSNNLFTYTKYSGFDPELGMDQYGIDMARYPQARSFILGATINF